MARKKQEIQLQREIETQEEWEEVMAMEGLWVVDVYQEWCGPCLALVGNFRRLKNELGDNLLNFAIAKADTIDALEKYRGRCEPTFLFYAGGILTNYIHGANAPKVQRVITEQLAHEHKVLEGTAERKEVRDPVITRMQEIEAEKLEEEEARQLAEDDTGTVPVSKTPSAKKVKDMEAQKGITVAIIKPDAVVQGKTDEIISLIKEHEFEILAQEQKEITPEEAEEFYADFDSESYFDDLVKFITSGPSYCLVLTKGKGGETVIKDWLDLLGPAEVEVAREEDPNCLRSRYGEKGYLNALHGSLTAQAAEKELRILFPNFVVPTYLRKKLNIQRTLALVRPEAYANKKEDIMQAISKLPLKVAMMKEVQLTKEQASELYKEHEQFGFFDLLVETMSSGTLLAIGLIGDEAISVWRDALGPENVDDAMEKAPKSLRARFPGSNGMNQFHGSASVEAAEKEIAEFFPIEQTVAMIKPSGMEHKDEILQRIEEAGFKIVAQQEVNITQTKAEIMYPHKIHTEYFDDLVNSLASGVSLYLVLSREDAVDGWRREIGNVDPVQAKEENPTSLRALYGTDILNNAVHGSSTVEHAKEEIKAVFGDLNFNPDGTLRGEEPQLDETAVEESEGQSEKEHKEHEEEKTEGHEKHEGEHKGEHEGEHKGEHKEEHEGEHKGEHKGEHEGEHKGEHEGEHKGEHKEEHEGEHKGEHKEEHEGEHKKHEGEHKEEHEGEHKEKPKEHKEGHEEGDDTTAEEKRESKVNSPSTEVAAEHTETKSKEENKVAEEQAPDSEPQREEADDVKAKDEAGGGAPAQEDSGHDGAAAEAPSADVAPTKPDTPATMEPPKDSSPAKPDTPATMEPPKESSPAKPDTPATMEPPKESSPEPQEPNEEPNPSVETSSKPDDTEQQTEPKSEATLEDNQREVIQEGESGENKVVEEPTEEGAEAPTEES
ncbi:thioredoxin domain-containing protein 6-like isoform X2 [Physella acuta]|uniref:thioredoxin domain-containing protein 6-like isoform X2 n=1 Tax=Physella acuta TaxID=109671 RepID=UPI0027DDAB27|nr:thioredoxin domain-containing protein 6-like isoform X2 [Physella acuta]